MRAAGPTPESPRGQTLPRDAADGIRCRSTASHRADRGRSMQSSTFTLTTPDGTDVFVNRWLPDGAARAIVQIAHGLAEHSSRYARFAQRLTDHGYAVYGSDHRGHGKTSGTRGSFAAHDGWQTVIDDLHSVTAHARHEQQGVPVFLSGHSMGSIISRGYAAQYGSELAGLVLSGTAG